MLSVFKKVAAAITATASYSIFTRIASVFQSNSIKFDEYYLYADYVVPSNHFLVTLINSIAVPHSVSLERFIDLTYQAGVAAGRGLGLGSAMSPMRILPKSYFFGDGHKEVIYLTDTEFQTDVPELWLGLSPIKFWSHGENDLSFKRLVGYQSSAKESFSVVEINLPLLMCQFRHFNNAQLELPTEYRKDVRHFVSLCIVNALKSQLNVAMFNRVSDTLTKKPLSGVTVLPGLSLQNPLGQVDSFIAQVIENITNRTLTWENVLSLIPLPYSTSALDEFRLPDQVQNRYARCFEIMATFKLVEFLTTVDQLSPGDKNTPYQTALRVYLDRALAENIWQTFEGDTAVIKERIEYLRKLLQ